MSRLFYWSVLLALLHTALFQVPAAANVQKKYAREKQLLSKSQGHAALDIHGGGLSAKWFKSGEEGFLWEKSYVGFSNQEDWSPYSSLLVDFVNPGEHTVAIQVEVKDADSRDYWSRANLSYEISPGHSQIRIPTKLFAGEALRPGRLLNARRIQSVIFARSSEENARLILTEIKLVKEASAKELGVWAFDFGPEGSPVFPGFESVTHHTEYKTSLGYGWVGAKVWNPYREACWVRGPDTLMGDCIMVYGGSFRVDLSPGRYRVALNVQHPGPFWGEYPSFERRKVSVNSKVLLDERGSPAEALKHYFRNEHGNFRSPEVMYQSLVQGRFAEQSLEIEVGTEGLKLDFLNEKCPHIPCFGLALTHLVVTPLSAPSAAEEFSAWLAKERREEFNSRTHFVVEAPKPLFTQLRADPVRARTFRENSLYIKIPIEVPAGTDKLQATWQGRKGVALAWAEPRLLRLAPDGSRVGVREKYLRWRTDFAELPSPLARTHLYLHVSADILKEDVQGSILLLASAQKALKIPVNIKVVPWTLPGPDLAYGAFGHTVRENWWPGLENTPRARSLLQQSLEHLRAAGLNMYSFEAEIVPQMQKNQIKDLELKNITEHMRRARAMGFRELVAYGHVLRDSQICQSSWNSGQWTQFFSLLERKSREENWLPLTVVLCDEPEGHDLQEVLRRVTLWPKLPESARVQWSLTTHVESRSSREHRKLAELLPKAFLADFELTSHAPKEKTPWFYYNDLSRWSYGLRTYALKARYGLRGRIAWTWNQNAVDPYNPLDGREDDYHWCTSTQEGKLLCTVTWYNDVVAGVEDYRRVLWLEGLSAKHAQSGWGKKARAFLEQIVAKAGVRRLDESEEKKLQQNLEALIEEAAQLRLE